MKNFILLFILGWCWGPSFLFIKLVIGELSPLSLIFYRITLAAIALMAICFLKKKNIFSYRSYFKHFLLSGLFSAAIPFFLISSGEKYIPSSLAAIVNGSVPIFVLILAIITKVESVTFKKILGVLLGVTGLLVVFMPSLSINAETSFLGVAMISVASIFYAIGMIYSRKYLIGLPPLIAPTGQLIFSSLFLLPFFLCLEYPYSLPSLKAMSGIVSLSLFGTIFAFILYYKILERTDASFLSLVTLLFPLIGMFLGMFFMRETLSWPMFIGAGLIFSALVFTNPYFARKMRVKKSRAS